MNQEKTKSNIKTLRKEQYDHHRKVMPFLSDWKKNPYTFLKAKFYMESSAVLVYFLLKYKISPNTVTILYAMCGIIGGVLFSLPYKTCILISLLIFFLKGILDWSDGHVARHTKKTSDTGHILDVYGAYLNELGFFTGLGFYIYNFSSYSCVIFIIPLYLFLVSINLNAYSKMIILNEMISGKIKLKSSENISSGDTENKSTIKSKFLNKFQNFINSLLDSRARTVDLICLIVILELTYGFNITFYLFILLIIKHFILFIGSLYYVINPTWVNNILNKISSNLN
jgi:phosphatidylglycerophosphate synthase